MANLPDTIWNPPDGNGQLSQGTVYSIADPAGVLLVDPSAVQVVDSGVIFTPLPDTTWVVADGS